MERRRIRADVAGGERDGRRAESQAEDLSRTGDESIVVHAAAGHRPINVPIAVADERAVLGEPARHGIEEAGEVEKFLEDADATHMEDRSVAERATVPGDAPESVHVIEEQTGEGQGSFRRAQGAAEPRDGGEVRRFGSSP